MNPTTILYVALAMTPVGDCPDCFLVLGASSFKYPPNGAVQFCVENETHRDRLVHIQQDGDVWTVEMPPGIIRCGPDGPLRAHQ